MNLILCAKWLWFLLRYLRDNLKYIDKEHLAVWGWSYGGFATAMILAQDEEVFRCGISVAPITSWIHYSENHKSYACSLTYLFACRFCFHWALHGVSERDGQLPRLRGVGHHQEGGQLARETFPAHSRHRRRQRALPAEHDAHSGAHRRGCTFPAPGNS